MNRTEEIKQQAKLWFDLPQEQALFWKGAEWADEHPSQQALAKELHRLGYSITLNGDIVPKADEDKMVENYIKYQKEKLIDKACEWLNDNCRRFIFTEQELNEFRKAMEG